MSRKIKFLLLPLIVLFLFSCSAEDAIISAEEETVTFSENADMETQILALVNEHRVSIGKQALQSNNVATNLAKDHTKYMIGKNKISHDNFTKRYEKLRDQANANGASENVAAGDFNAKTVVEAWLNSPGHRKNIEGDFTHIGIAALKNAEGRYYYTQLFYN